MDDQDLLLFKDCKHADALVQFSATEAVGLSASEIRKRWPRFYGYCPTCKIQLTRYASLEHYIAGDW